VDTPAPAGEHARLWIARAWRAVKRLYLFSCRLLQLPALLLVAFALVVSAQGYDIIARLAEDDPTGAERSNDGQRAGYVIGVIFLALQVWYWSRQLLHVRPAEGRPRAIEYPWLTAWLRASSAFWRSDHTGGAVARGAQLRRARAGGRAAQARDHPRDRAIAFIVHDLRRKKVRFGRPRAALRERPLGAKIFMGGSVLLAIVFIWATFFVQSTIYLGSAVSCCSRSR
jgi:hypothetical protein